MNIMHFSSKDLCTIIKSCKKAQIEELKYGDLILSFRSKREKTPLLGQEVKQTDKPITNVTDVNEQGNVIQDELEIRDNQIANLVVEDPELFEEMLANNELEMEDTDGTIEGERPRPAIPGWGELR